MFLGQCWHLFQNCKLLCCDFSRCLWLSLLHLTGREVLWRKKKNSWFPSLKHPYLSHWSVAYHNIFCFVLLLSIFFLMNLLSFDVTQLHPIGWGLLMSSSSGQQQWTAAVDTAPPGRWKSVFVLVAGSSISSVNVLRYIRVCCHHLVRWADWGEDVASPSCAIAITNTLTTSHHSHRTVIQVFLHQKGFNINKYSTTSCSTSVLNRSYFTIIKPSADVEWRRFKFVFTWGCSFFFNMLNKLYRNYPNANKVCLKI